jgi:hypothetical protein
MAELTRDRAPDNPARVARGAGLAREDYRFDRFAEPTLTFVLTALLEKARRTKR